MPVGFMATKMTWYKNSANRLEDNRPTIRCVLMKGLQDSLSVTNNHTVGRLSPKPFGQVSVPGRPRFHESDVDGDGVLFVCSSAITALSQLMCHVKKNRNGQHAHA